MISTGALRRAAMALLMAVCIARPASAQPPANDATLLRVFLKDGSALLSYGEFSRVGDHVVISLPLRLDPIKLQVVSIPQDRVDWDKTDAYADSARATQYADTTGPADFTSLQSSVSRLLADIGHVQNPERKIALATEARQNLSKWLAGHFGYRAHDVAQMADQFDAVIAKARQATGQPNFDLSLIAANAAPPSVPLLPAPDNRSVLRQSYQAAEAVDSAWDRIVLLRAIRDSLQRSADPGLTSLKAEVAHRLADEERTTAMYATYVRQVLRAAARLAEKADVQALVRMSGRILEDDDRMGHKRPEELASLLTAVDAKLEAARELRLKLDQWQARQELRSAYTHGIADSERALRLSRSALADIQQLAGPAPDVLGRTKTRLTLAKQTLDVVKPPPEMEAVHALLVGAMQLATRAVESRFAAVQGGSMAQAKDAASAAAGALLLFDRATQELQRSEAPPQLK